VGYRVSYEARDHYRLAKVSGQYDPAEARELLKVVGGKAAEGKFRHILIDATEVSSPPSELD
jgi:hypothetical protein